MNVYACLFIYLYTYICMYPALNVYNKKYIKTKSLSVKRITYVLSLCIF